MLGSSTKIGRIGEKEGMDASDPSQKGPESEIATEGDNEVRREERYGWKWSSPHRTRTETTTAGDKEATNGAREKEGTDAIVPSPKGPESETATEGDKKVTDDAGEKEDTDASYSSQTGPDQKLPMVVLPSKMDQKTRWVPKKYLQQKRVQMMEVIIQKS
jgi:hypothetical protein